MWGEIAMSNTTIGKITSEPNNKGEHTLKCPQCSTIFLSKIMTDDITGLINNIVCLVCGYKENPKIFVAAAHQSEINEKAMDYAAKELKKVFRKFGK